jgi:hypothetical protein
MANMNKLKKKDQFKFKYKVFCQKIITILKTIRINLNNKIVNIKNNAVIWEDYLGVVMVDVEVAEVVVEVGAEVYQKNHPQ